MPANPTASPLYVNGDLSRLGLSSTTPGKPPISPPPFVTGAPILRGQEHLTPEEKARVLTNVWMDNVTEDDIKKMRAGDIRKISEIAGIGQKKDSPLANEIIMAILAAIAKRGCPTPELLPQVVEGEVLHD